MCFKQKKMQARACIFSFYSFFFLDLRLPNSFWSSGAKNAGARHTNIFIAIYPFPTNLVVQYMRRSLKNVRAAEKFLSLCLALGCLQDFHGRAEHDLIVFVRERLLDLLNRYPLDLCDLALARLDLLLCGVR